MMVHVDDYADKGLRVELGAGGGLVGQVVLNSACMIELADRHISF